MIIPAADPYQLIEWRGNAEAYRLETWPLYVKFGNRYLLADIYNVLTKAICPYFFKKWGIQTVFYDLSMDHYWSPGEEYGHPEEAHEYGRANDTRYPGWESGVLNVEATRDWFLVNQRIFEYYRAYVGPDVKSTAGKGLIFVDEATELDAHRFIPGNRGSHCHNGYTLGKTLSPIYWEEVRRLL